MQEMQELFKYLTLLKEKTELMVQLDINHSKQLELLSIAINALHSLHKTSSERIDHLESVIATFKRPVLHTDN